MPTPEPEPGIGSADASRRSLRPPTREVPATQPWNWLFRWIARPVLVCVEFVLKGL